MKGKNFITLLEINSIEMERILQLALELKGKQKKGIPHPILAGKTLAMFFEKPSSRTRVSFDTGMYQLGGYTLNLLPSELQMGTRETVSDVAKVLSRYVDLVMMRVIHHSLILEFAKDATIPVINGLSDLEHPCQAVADMLTILEHKGDLSKLKLCYVGDGNNVCDSLIQAAALVKMQITVACPEGYEPKQDPKVTPYEVVTDPLQAVKDADVVYTDVWTSMGQEKEKEARLKAFASYTVTQETMTHAKPGAIFMHCLPAHRGEEVTAEVVDGPQSVVFDQAENRMHGQKAIMALLAMPLSV